MGKSPINGPFSIAMFVYQRVKYSIQATTTMMGIVPMTKASAVREMSMTIAAIAVTYLGYELTNPCLSMKIQLEFFSI